MNFDLSDEQKMLAETVRRVFGEMSPPSRLRTLVEEGETIDRPLWTALARMGFVGAGIAEADGGLGLGVLELALVAQEAGRAAAAIPLLSSAGLAAQAIAFAGTPEQRARWLPGIADGTIVAAFATAEGGTDVWADIPRAALVDGTLSGTKWPVADLAIADVAIVACALDHRPALAIVDLCAAGVERVPLVSIDPLRSLGELRLSGVPSARLGSGTIAPLLERLLDRAAMLTAFEQIGGAEACLDMALAYVATRRIFGKPLAGYQAVKHNLADIYVAIELARSNAFFAAWAAMTDAPQRGEAAAVARLSAMDAYEMAARENLQLHGGIGYTWEADCHFHYRRERLLRLALGGTGRWAARLIDALPAPHAARAAA